MAFGVGGTAVPYVTFLLPLVVVQAVVHVVAHTVIAITMVVAASAIVILL